MLNGPKIMSVMRRILRSRGPHHAQWMVTRRCNYRCRGCGVWADQESIELSTDEVERGLDILRDLGVWEIVFSGGNPLIRDDIGEILQYASRNFVTTVYDNGSLAEEKIESLRNVDFVAISVDTLDERKNDYLKGVPGAWNRAMHAIEALKGDGIPVGVSPTISQLNLYEIIDFTKHFVSRGIPVWYCFYWYDYPFENTMFPIGKKSDEYGISDKKTLADVCTNLMEMKKKNSNIYITHKTLDALRHLALTGERMWSCRALSNFLVIDHKGRVAGCHSQESLASIFELPKLWNSSRFRQLRREYNKCGNCAYLCYIFYSLHSGFSGNIQVLRDQWENTKSYMRSQTETKYQTS